MADNRISEREIALFESIPGSNVFVAANAPLFTILSITDTYLPHNAPARRALIGQPFFEVLPQLGVSDAGLLRTSFDTVVRTKQKHEVLAKSNKETDGPAQPAPAYCQQPFLDESGNVLGLIHTRMSDAGQIADRRKLEESEQQVRSLVQSAPFPIGVYVGPEMRIVLANPSLIAVFGKGPDVIGKSYKSILPELENQEIFNQLDAVLATGVAFHAKNQQVDIVRNNKLETFYFNYSFTPLFDAAGQVYGIMNTAADVTDLVLAKKATEISEEKARLAIASADLGTYELDLATNEMQTSERFQEIWGVKDTLDRAAFATVIHPLDLATRQKATEEAYKTTYLDYEARLVPAPGVLKWVAVRGRVLYDGEANPKRILGVVQDITEQKLFAEELAKQVRERTEALETSQAVLLQSHTYLQKTINQFETALAALVPVYEGDAIADFQLKLINEAYGTYARHSPERLLGQRVSAIFPGYTHGDAFARHLHTFTTGSSSKWEFHDTDTETSRHFQVTASKVGSEVVVQLTDITALKNLQLELEHKIVELERSNKNLEEFAYAASHDLKEPIRKIHFFCDRVRTSLSQKLSPDEDQYLQRIELAAKRMSSLIDDLLTYSQVSFQPGFVEPVDLNQILNLVLSDLDLEVAQKQAHVHAEGLCTVPGHHRQLQQAFQNLIGNALKYSKPNLPPRVAIRCSQKRGTDLEVALSPAERNQRFCAIEVSDNGIGFDPQDAERMFNMFTRLHGDEATRGTGVGLSIVRKVVQNHNGYIVAQGQPGVGAVFNLYLPLPGPA